MKLTPPVSPEPLSPDLSPDGFLVVPEPACPLAPGSLIEILPPIVLFFCVVTLTVFFYIAKRMKRIWLKNETYAACFS